MLLKNCYIKTITKGDLKGDILIENGKVKEIGSNLNTNDKDIRVIDVQGHMVTPGLIDGHAHIGVWQEGVGIEGDDTSETSNPVMPELRVIDAIKPGTIEFKEAIKAGVTTAAVGPGSSNVVSGQFAVIKLSGDRIDDMILKDPAAVKIAFGENPKYTFGIKKQAPVTRMGVASLIRELLVEAKDYYKNRSNNTVPYNPRLEAMIPVIEKKIPLKAHAHQIDDIFTAIRIKNEFDIRLTIEHCTAGWQIADQIADEDIDCFLGPLMLFGDKHEGKDLNFQGPNILQKAGVRIALITDAPITPLKYLPLMAGLAVKSGLSKEEAWKAITINPAQILDIDKRVGSIDIGKDADLAIFDKDPLENLDCNTIMTIIDGKIVFSINK